MAERVGFEPTVPFGTHAFQACALSHSAISPQRRHPHARRRKPSAHFALRASAATIGRLAEREGFEPSIGFTLYTLSRGALSATQPPLRAAAQVTVSHEGQETTHEFMDVAAPGARAPRRAGPKVPREALRPMRWDSRAAPDRARGESWRRGRDSNPRDAQTPGGFQDRCLQPLGHLSVKDQATRSPRMVREVVDPGRLRAAN